MYATFGKIITTDVPARNGKDGYQRIEQKGWLTKPATDDEPQLTSAFMTALPRDLPEGYPPHVKHVPSFEHFTVNQYGSLEFNRFASFVTIDSLNEVSNKPKTLSQQAKVA